MAKQSVREAALAEIDSKIADLNRAKDIIIATTSGEDAPAEAPKKRGRKPKRGLPAQPANDSGE